MNTLLRASLIAVCGLILGGFGNGLLSTIPLDTQDDDQAQATAWELPVQNLEQVRTVQAIWAERLPWGAPPPPEPVVEAEPPAPVLIGVVRQGRSYRAVFMIEGAGQLILPAGAALPGGGRVVSVAGLNVTWVDAKRNRHQRQVFDTYSPESSL